MRSVNKASGGAPRRPSTESRGVLEPQLIVAVERALLHDSDLVQIGRTLLLFRNTVPPVQRDTVDLAGDAASTSIGLPTFVSGLADVFAAVERVAASTTPVMVRGERGTGKEQ